MRKVLLTGFLSLLALLGSVASHGDETARQFDIELILFANINAHDGGEAWPVEEHSGWSRNDRDTLPDTEDMAPLDMARQDPDGWTRLPESEHRLTAVADALRRSASYRPLAHVRWRQAVLAPDASPSIDFTALTGRAQQEATPRVVGNLRLSVARYLHLETDLRLVEDHPYAAWEPGTRVFPLRQSRRMRSGELHYIDHPRMGILVLVTPYTAAP